MICFTTQVQRGNACENDRGMGEITFISFEIWNGRKVGIAPIANILDTESKTEHNFSIFSTALNKLCGLGGCRNIDRRNITLSTSLLCTMGMYGCANVKQILTHHTSVAFMLYTQTHILEFMPMVLPAVIIASQSNKRSSSNRTQCVAGTICAQNRNVNFPNRYKSNKNQNRMCNISDSVNITSVSVLTVPSLHFLIEFIVFA